MKAIRLMIPVLSVWLAAGCGKKSAGGPPPGAMSVQVRATPALVQPIENRISLVASLSPNEMIEIKSRLAGSIEEINFAEGDRVEKGRLLFRLDKGKLEASVKEAEAQYNLAKANLERSRSMMENRTISQQEFDQAKATYESGRATLDRMKQQLEDSRIYATFEGIMGARLVSLGQVVTPDDRLGTLVDVDPIKVEFRVPERFIGQLAAGQTIEFKVAAYPGESFGGEVYFIDPQVDLNTRTVLVKATTPNTDGRLRPGMFGNLDLILRVKERAVVVPERALVIEGDRTSVYIVDKTGAAQPVDVEVGLRLAGQAEITRGLQGGETVITEGTQKLHPGANVTISPADDPAPAGNQP